MAEEAGDVLTEEDARRENDWTIGSGGRSNTSEEFMRLVDEIERLIRGDAHTLISGRADRTAGLIVAQLAHKHDVGPRRPTVSQVRNVLYYVSGWLTGVEMGEAAAYVADHVDEIATLYMVDHA